MAFDRAYRPPKQRVVRLVPAMLDNFAQSVVPLKPASRNPWYILATIHGEDEDDDLRENNFFTWNCYFSSQFSETMLNQLNERLESPGRRAIEKLSDQDSKLISEVFREGRGQGLQLPEPHQWDDFSSTEFPTSFLIIRDSHQQMW